MSPTSRPWSATMATCPRWNIGSRSVIGASGAIVSSWVLIAVATGSDRRFGSACRCISRSDSSTMPTSRSPCMTGICETSNRRMRIGQQQAVLGRERHCATLLIAPHDQIEQIAVPRALDQALIEQPVVVVHLVEIFVAAVGHQRGNALGRALLAAVAQRRGQQRAAAGAPEDALARQQLARRAKTLRVTDLVHLAHTRQIAGRWHEVLADALDEPAAGWLLNGPGANHIRENRACGVGQHHLYVRCHALEVARQTRERAAAADADHHGIQ